MANVEKWIARRRMAALAGLFAVACTSASAQTAMDFYRERTINLVVSTSVGGGYDLLGRAVGRLLGKHMPGNPRIVVRNMAGAGGTVAANFLYNVAEKDGATIGLVQDSTPFKPLLGANEGRYDANRFNWLGSSGPETSMLVIRGGLPIGSLADLKEQVITVGAAAANSVPAMYARLFNEVFGTKLKVIIGYPGNAEAFLAMEKAEIDGYPSVFYSTLQAMKPDWLPTKKIKALLYYGSDRRPELADVAYAPALVTNENDRLLVDAAFAPLTVGKLFVAPPDVPTQRVAALHEALRATFADPEFIAEAARLRLDPPEPLTGEQIRDVIRRVYAAPPRIRDRLQQLSMGGR
jgi:tripartite-type tricarboxylate transporter receptor subunit TctC